MKSLRKAPLFWKRGLLVLGLGAGFGMASWSPSIMLSAQEAQPAAVGLRGILPASAPAGLGEDDFVAIGPSWEEWSKGAAASVASFYDNEKLDAAGQRAALAVLKTKLGTMEKALGDRAYAQIHDRLATQHGRLLRRVTVAEAVLDTLELNPATAQQARVQAARADVSKSAAALDAYLGGIDGSKPWSEYVKLDALSKLTSNDVGAEVLSTVQSRLSNPDKLQGEQQQSFLKRAAFQDLKSKLGEYLELANAPAPKVNVPALRDALTKMVANLEQFEETRSAVAANGATSEFLKVRSLSPDGGDRLADALSTSYFNYNLRVIASETFLSKVAAESHSETGPVRDFILGANVSGSQTTNTTIGIDVMPSNGNIAFALTLTGVSQTSTAGVTEQATVFTSGYHQFWAKKPVAFDGDKFMTGPATIEVATNNTTTGARTGASGVPILGGIIDNYAVGKAREKRGESEAIAAQRLRDKVLPRLNEEADGKFADYSKKLDSQFIAKLKENNLFPSARSFRSTDTDVFASTRLMQTGEVSGDATRLPALSSTGASVHMHETLLNNAIDRMNLGGRKFTEQELAKEILNGLSVLFGREFKIGEKKADDAKPDSTKFVLPAKDAFRIRFENGQVVLVIRTGLEPEGSEPVPTQEITVPIAVSLEAGSVKLEAGQVTVTPVEAVANPLTQRARSAVVTSKIQKSLPTRTVKGAFDLKHDDGSVAQVAIRQLKANGGWLSIVLE